MTDRGAREKDARRAKHDVMVRGEVRIALFSDVHGNAAALRAVLEAIDRAAPDRIFALGDLVGRGPEPERVVRMIAERGILFIRGNWDGWVAGEHGWDERPKRRAHVEVARRLMKRATIEKLLEGPPTRRLSIAGCTLYLAHGSPRDPVELLGPDTPDEVVREAIAPAEDADVVALGHSHRPFVRWIGRTLVVNSGTVGYPFDGDPRASFALLSIDAHAKPRAEIVRVPYAMSENLRAVARAVKKSAMPAEVASRYRRALLGEGDALSAPRANEGDALPAPRANEGDALSAPRANEGEAVAVPRANEGEAVAVPRANEGEAVAVPRANEGEAVSALLMLLAPRVQVAYSPAEPAFDALLDLRAAIEVALPSLPQRRALRALEKLDRELALHEKLRFAESLALRDGPLAELASTRVRRLKRRAADLYPRDRRIRLGLVWLELAMHPRKRPSATAVIPQRETIDASSILARWRKRAQKLGGSGAT